MKRALLTAALCMLALVASLWLRALWALEHLERKDDPMRRQAICKANGGTWEIDRQHGACVDNSVLE